MKCVNELLIFQWQVQEFYVLTAKEAKYSYWKPRALKKPRTQNSRRKKKKQKTKKQKNEESEKKSNKLTTLTNSVIKHNVL